MGQWSDMVVDSRGKYLTAVQMYGGCFVSPPSTSDRIISDGNWTATSAPSANWKSVASDSTGQYIVAVQLRDNEYNGAYIYTSSSGIYLHTLKSVLSEFIIIILLHHLVHHHHN